MRVVIDTNVLVSACIGGGPTSRVMEACLTGKTSPVVGASLLLEYRDVLGRDALFRAARLNSEERQLLLRAFVSCCQWQDVFFLWRPNLPDEADNHVFDLPDEADNHVFELAVAANSATIVTFNPRDFHRHELRFPDLRIATPETFLGGLSL